MIKKLLLSKTLILALIMLFPISTSLFAQEQNDEWKPLTTIDGVEISYMKADCEESLYLFIKTKNTTSESSTISLKYDFSINGESLGSGILSLKNLAGQTELSGDCDTGLKINVYNHLSMFDESTVTLTITKNQN